MDPAQRGGNEGPLEISEQSRAIVLVVITSPHERDSFGNFVRVMSTFHRGD